MDAGTADSSKVASEAPQPTHINVHIHEESALAQLLLTGCSLLRIPATATATSATTQTLGSSRLLVASWVVQIVLGLLSGVLGGFLYILMCYRLCSSGAAIWTGPVAVLAGAAAFVYEKQGGICWALLRTLLTLAAFCTAIAAIVIGAGNFSEYHNSWTMSSDYICEASSSNWHVTPPSTLSPKPERQRLCISQVNMLKNLSVSLQSMLLGVWVLLLLASLVPLCLYCWKRFSIKEGCLPLPLLEKRPEEAAGSKGALALLLLSIHI
ncbi:transmembrane protein 176A isoform X1 [Heterocephalus glaber]|uniref:Transmembrane protein 176A isoform X1 n=1 Tax=Heterocephalus glaber TaxID=10181 RepID=A0AAX6R3B2_HETGA|nr:transmembrane protein 176A isoform X1 [Heterocephalus glaber]XP_012933501.1 transmembrane protein 176A isoform X1 [Heterocephalus glaber]